MALVSVTAALTTTPSIVAGPGSPFGTLNIGGVGDKITCVIGKPSAAILVGGPNCNTTGIAMTTTDVLAIDLGPGDTLYACAATGTANVNVINTRV